MRRACATCHWWETLDDRSHGTCHGAPPTAAQNGMGVWPITLPDASCAGWRMSERLIQRQEIDA